MRPLWRCRNCGAEWPCQPARLSLLSEYQGNRTSLLIYLSGLMAEARDQLAKLNSHHVPDLTDRFITWARTRN
ncbi:flavin reductase [Micromonospora olivasterospora]|nr:flavin reductase [Micromonospora olivasterospora]